MDYKFLYESFHKHFFFLYMNGWLSKIGSVHTYVIPRTVYFDWICTFPKSNQVWKPLVIPIPWLYFHGIFMFFVILQCREVQSMYLFIVGLVRYTASTSWRWNLTSKKSSTETEYRVWKLLSCSFTYQSQKNLIL